MLYPCGIIKDLLPLYVDHVCNAESKTAVEYHLAECENCKSYYEQIKSGENFIEEAKNPTEDLQMVNRLKSIKKKLHKKSKMMIFGSLGFAAVLFLGYQILFQLPLKEVDVEDVAVFANVYATNDLVEYIGTGSEDSVLISIGEDDTGEVFSIAIPELPEQEIFLSEDAVEKVQYISVISWQSPYYLKEIRFADETAQEEDTMYISGFRTTLLDNRAKAGATSSVFMDMKEIRKIVYISDTGEKKILWERGKENPLQNEDVFSEADYHYVSPYESHVVK